MRSHGRLPEPRTRSADGCARPCDRCAASCATSGSLLVPVATSGSFDWTARANGVYYFKCDVGSHCTAGGARAPGRRACQAASARQIRPGRRLALAPQRRGAGALRRRRRAQPTGPHPLPHATAGNMVLPVTVTGCTTRRTAEGAVSSTFTRGL